MHHLYEKAFNTGTWFTTILYFFKEYIHADVVFSSIISMMTLTLLVLQITNQWHIRQERKKNKKK